MVNDSSGSRASGGGAPGSGSPAPKGRGLLESVGSAVARLHAVLLAVLALMTATLGFKTAQLTNEQKQLLSDKDRLASDVTRLAQSNSALADAAKGKGVIVDERGAVQAERVWSEELGIPQFSGVDIQAPRAEVVEYLSAADFNIDHISGKSSARLSVTNGKNFVKRQNAPTYDECVTGIGKNPSSSSVFDLEPGDSLCIDISSGVRHIAVITLESLDPSEPKAYVRVTTWKVNR